MSIKLPKPNKYGTVSRSAIQKLVAAGLMEAKCEGRYTDDYAWDNASNFGKTEWLPCRIKEDNQEWSEHTISFFASDFSTRFKTGSVHINKDGTYRFYIHSNLSYTLRIKGV